MSFSNKGNRPNDTELNSPGKATALNPNATEFVPFALRSPAGITGTADVTARFASSATLGKAVFDRSESSVSINSDEEARQYWSRQLPDDITPDFNVMGEDESQVLGNLSLAGLSLHDGSETSRYTAAGSGYLLNQRQELSPHHINGNNFTEKMKYSGSPFVEDPSSAKFLNLPIKPWDKQNFNSNPLISNGREGSPYNGNSRHGFLNDMLIESTVVEQKEINPLEFLATQFPGFAAESLLEVYFANHCDLNLTIEMLTQLELQVDGGLYPNLNARTLSAPNLSTMDFPTLPVPNGHNGIQKYAGDDLQQSASPYRSSVKDNMLLFNSSSSMPSRGAVDYASAVKKLAPQDSSIWKYDTNLSPDASIGSSRSSHALASSYNSGHVRAIYDEKLQNHASTRAAPAWLDTGEAVANLYSELREEACDKARLRNVYFEQARQAYLIGNKALAKELNGKGQLHNIHMKAAYGQAQDSIYRQRNPVSPEMQGNGRGRERMIDLHGLHVSEAIVVLKNELSVLRSTARSAEQRLQVYIGVGTGHHTRGTRTPARLPVAVQRYLLEEEGLDYTEPQPGLLRVVIY